MASTSEFIDAWLRLDLRDLQAIATIARDPRTAAISRKLAVFLAESLNAEADHREHFATKPDQVPAWDSWTDGEIADGYMCSVAIERAAAPSERLSEWAELLRRCICNEMVSRIRAMDLARELHGHG